MSVMHIDFATETDSVKKADSVGLDCHAHAWAAVTTNFNITERNGTMIDVCVLERTAA